MSCIRNGIRGWVGHLVRVRYQPSSTPFVRYGGIIVTRRPSYFFLGHGILISYPISCAFWVQTCVPILVSRRRIAGASDGSLQSPLVDGSRSHSVPIVSLLAEYFVCAVLRQRERESGGTWTIISQHIPARRIPFIWQWLISDCSLSSCLSHRPAGLRSTSSSFRLPRWNMLGRGRIGK